MRHWRNKRLVRPPAFTAFTLVELLVVVGIIVILVAIIVPSLELGAAAAQRSKCASNLSAIGKAITTYVNEDTTNRYPQTFRYYMLLGQAGKAKGYRKSDGTEENKDDMDSDRRPLNRFLGVTGPDAEVKVAQCPADKGGQAVLDSDNNRAFGETGTEHPTVFQSTGNSYVEAYGSLSGSGGPVHTARTGIAFMFGTDPNSPSQAKPAASKVLVGDAPLHGQNQYATDARNRWHDPDPTQRKFNILFADNHVEFYAFAKNASGVPVIETLAPTAAGDPSRGFW